MDQNNYPLTDHLSELRSRLIKAILAVIATMSLCLIWAPQLLDIAIAPLQEVLKKNLDLKILIFSPENTQSLREKMEQIDPDLVYWLAQSWEQSMVALKKESIDMLVFESKTNSLEDSLEELSTLSYIPRVVHLKDKPEVSKTPFRPGISVMSKLSGAFEWRSLIQEVRTFSGKLSQSDKLVVLSPLEPFFAYLKIAFVLGLFLACPIWLYQGWMFVAPGLYAHEKKATLPAVLGGAFLFIAGGCFAYLTMFPLMFDVLVNQMMPESLAASFTVDNYLSLLLRVTVAFGVVFELPLALALLAKAGIVNASQLKSFRKYAWVLAFILGAFLTPADPVSQIMMSLPLVLFYELGIFLAGLLGSSEDASSDL